MEMNLWTNGLHIPIGNDWADRAVKLQSQFSKCRSSRGHFLCSRAQATSATSWLVLHGCFASEYKKNWVKPSVPDLSDMLLEEIWLGLTWSKEANHSEGLDLVLEGIGLSLEVVEFINWRIYKKRRDLRVFSSRGGVLALCSLYTVSLFLLFC